MPRARPLAFKKYGARDPGARRPYGQLEGEGRPRNVVIEFPSYDDAIACYNSPEYQAAKAKRKGAGEADIVIVEGVLTDAKGLLDGALSP